MSGRRAARDRRPRPVTARPGDLPAAFRIGALVEVWADPATDGQMARAVPRYRSTRRRYRSALAHWRLTHLDRGPLRPGFWSLEDGPELTERNLSQAGCTLDDLDRLRAEAAELLEQARSSSAELSVEERTIRA